MNVIERPDSFVSQNRPVCLAIGFFDGVHVGHQRVLQETLDGARQLEGLAVAITFSIHPTAIVAPQSLPLLIYPLHHKTTLLQTTGIDWTWTIPFNESFSRLSPAEFLAQLLHYFAPVRTLCVGTNFVFGYRQAGNLAFLQEAGPRGGFQVRGLAPVNLEDAPVSSTRIRELIRHGNFAEAARLLGRTYALHGRVVRGDQLGRTIGVPTANLDTRGLAIPPSGVYAGWIQARGSTLPAVANVGNRPTFQHSNPSPRVEVHILDWAGELYGEVVAFAPVRRLRAEHSFQNFQALKTQIIQDIHHARVALASAPIPAAV